MDNSKKEAILSAWLNMIIAIDSQRITSLLPFNEAVVCNYLNNHRYEELTATDLCKMMKMQKSLMNRTLTSLENKGLVKRTYSKQDKRKIVVNLNEDQGNVYYQQHELILDYIERILAGLDETTRGVLDQVFEAVTQATKSLDD